MSKNLTGKAVGEMTVAYFKFMLGDIVERTSSTASFRTVSRTRSLDVPPIDGTKVAPCLCLDQCSNLHL
jgi:hypothetical protein